MSLSSRERTEIKNILIDRFSMSELEELAFDLAVNREVASQGINVRTYAMRLIEHFENRGRLSCLILEMMKARPDLSAYLKDLLNKLTVCDQGVAKATLILNTELPARESSILSILAKILGIDEGEIEIIAATRGSMRVLVSFPEKAVNFRVILQNLKSLRGSDKVISFVLFDMLSLTAQNAWRYTFHYVDLIIENNMLLPTISWDEAVEGSIRYQLHAQNQRNYHRSDVPLSSEFDEKSQETEIERTANSIRPRINLSDDPLPIDAHVKVDGRYRWYLVEQRQTDDFIPQIHSQDWLLVFTQPDQSDLTHTEEQPIVIVCQSVSGSTIHLRPHPSEQVTQSNPIYLRESRGESWSFVRNPETGEVFLTPEGREDVVNLEKIIGIVVGLWRPAKQMVDDQ